MITYLFFKVFEYFKTKDTDIDWQKSRALIATSGILVINIITVLYFLNSIFNKEQNLLIALRSGVHFIDKFIILPILVSPVFLFVYFIGYKRLDDKVEQFRNEANDVKRKKKILLNIYFVLSFLLFSLAIFSPLYLK